jgi:hypothetical protein
MRLIDQFKRYEERNPQFYEVFCQYAFQLIDSGHTRFSPAAIFERIRWEMATNLEHDYGFRVNDRYAALYSRKFMKQYPQYNGFFETRRQTAVTEEELETI